MTNASNTTANYGLSQWSATDLVKMEDFNSDNAAIDAALHTQAQSITAMDTAYQAADTAITAAYQAADTAHTSRTDNPHGVTAAQVGAAAASHTHAASDLTYSNSTSGLAAQNVQAAIDEVKSSVASFHEMVFGTYTGNGSTSKTISLGFAPVCVMVFFAKCGSSALSNYTGYWGGQCAMAFTDNKAWFDSSGSYGYALKVTSTGFQIGAAVTESNGFLHTNVSGFTYNYVAFK